MASIRTIGIDDTIFEAEMTRMDTACEELESTSRGTLSISSKSKTMDAYRDRLSELMTLIDSYVAFLSEDIATTRSFSSTIHAADRIIATGLKECAE